MAFKNRLKMRIKLLKFGKLYTFSRIVTTNPNPPDPPLPPPDPPLPPPDPPVPPTPEELVNDAYKIDQEWTITFTEQAFIRPARAYNIHSDQYQTIREGGNEMSGIINIEVLYTSGILVGDSVSTANGVYDIVAKEDFDEVYIFEAHRR